MSWDEILGPVGTCIEHFQVRMLPPDTEDTYCEILDQSKAWVPMIWPQQGVPLMRARKQETGLGVIGIQSHVGFNHARLTCAGSELGVKW